MGEKDLKKRTKSFAISIIKLVQYINEHGSVAAKIISNKQLIRSGTGIASNYRGRVDVSPVRISFLKWGL